MDRATKKQIDFIMTLDGSRRRADVEALSNAEASLVIDAIKRKNKLKVRGEPGYATVIKKMSNQQVLDMIDTIYARLTNEDNDVNNRLRSQLVLLTDEAANRRI